MQIVNSALVLQVPDHMYVQTGGLDSRNTDVNACISQWLDTNASIINMRACAQVSRHLAGYLAPQKPCCVVVHTHLHLNTVLSNPVELSRHQIPRWTFQVALLDKVQLQSFFG